MAVDNLDFKVSIETKQADKNLKNLQKSLAAFNKEAKVFNKAIGGVVKGFRSLTKVTAGMDKNIVASSKAMRSMNRTLKSSDRAIQTYTRNLSMTGKASKIFRHNFDRVSDSLKQTNRTLAKMSKPLKNLGGLMKAAKGSSSGVKNLDQRTTKLDTSFGKLAASTITLNQAMEVFHKTLRAIRAIQTFTVDNFAEFEKNLTGVAKTADLSRAETENMGFAIQDLSTRIPVAQNSLLKFAQAAGQLGVKGSARLTKFAETMAKVEVATNLTGEEAALSFTRILNTTGTSIDKIEEFSSVIVKLGNTFADQESGIVRTANVIAQGLGANFGVAADEVAALAAASRDLGVRFELAGSGLTRTFVEINKIIATGGKQLSEFSGFLGQTNEEVTKNFGEKPLKVFRRFLESLSKISDIDRPRVLEAFNINGVEVLRVIPTLAKGIDKVNIAFESAAKEMAKPQELARETARAFDTLGADMKISANVIQNIGIDIGRALSPYLRQAEKDFRKLTMEARKFITSFIFAFRRIDFDLLVRAFGEVAKAVGAVVGMGLSIWFAKLIGPTVALTLKFGILTGAILGLAAGIIVVQDNLDRLDDVLATVGGAFQTWVEYIAGAFNQLALYIVTNLKMMAKSVKDNDPTGFLGSRLTSVIDTLKETQKSLQEDIKISNIEMEDLAKNTGDAMSNLDLSRFKIITNEIQKFLANLKQAPKGFKLTNSAVDDLMKKMQQLSNFDGALPIAEVANELKKLEAEINKLHESNLVIQGKHADLVAFRQHMLMVELSLLRDRFTKEGKINELLAGTDKTYGQILDKALELGKIELEDEVFSFRLRPLLDDLDEMSKKAVEFGKKLKKSIEDSTVDVLRGGLPGALDNLPTMEELGQGAKEIGKGIGKDFGNAVQDFDWGAAAAAYANVWVSIIEGVIELLTPATLNKFSDQLSRFVKDLPKELVQAFSKMENALASFIENLPTALMTIITAIPKHLAKLQEMTPALAAALRDGLLMVMDAIPMITDVILQTGLTAILDMLPVLIRRFHTFQTELTLVTLRNLPRMVKEIADELPAVIDAIIQGSGEATEMMVVGVIDFILSGGLEKIVVALVIGIVKGIGAALSSIFKRILNIGDMFKSKKIETNFFDPKEIEEQFTRVASAFTNVSDRIFNVIDLQAEAKGLDAADRINKIFDQGVTRFVMKFRGLIDILLETWRGIYDNFSQFLVMPIVEAWRRVFNWFTDKFGPIVADAWHGVLYFFTEEFGAVIGEAWHRTINWFTDKFGPIISDAWKGTLDWFTESLGPAISSSWKGTIDFFSKDLGAFVSDAFKSVTDAFGNMGTMVFEAFKPVFNFFDTLGVAIGDAFGGIFDTFKTLGNLIDFNAISASFSAMFSNLNPGSMLSKVFAIPDSAYTPKGTIENILGFNMPFVSFAQGGVVPGSSPVPGDNLMNDRIVALLSPGEVVIPRSISQDPEHQPIIQAIMSGVKLPAFAGGFIEQQRKRGEKAIKNTPVGDAVDAAKDAGGKISEGAKAVGGKISDAGKSVYTEGFLGPLIEYAKTRVAEMFQNMARSNLGFATGGLVPGVGSGDSVQAMLTPGEFVMNRGAVSQFGSQFFENLNSGKTPSMGGDTNITLNLDFKTTKPIDEDLVRQRLIPTMKKEIRQASLRGEPLVSKRGVF